MKPVEPPPKEPPRYTLPQVAAAVVVFFALVVCLDARGLYRWTQKLPVSERTTKLRKVAEEHWARTSRYGLEEPKFTLERWFLDFQEAHPLLYPRKYEDVVARRKKKAEQKEIAAAKAPVKARGKALAAKAAPPSLQQRPSVLLVGDSIMAGIGPVIKRDVVEKLAGSAVVKARVATGLARPDVFDWRQELKRAVSADRFDYIVLMLGTNDSQDFVEGGEILTYGTAPWVKAYNRRIDEMMATACKGAARAIWVGLPPMQSAAFNRKAVRINSWTKRQAARHKCIEFVTLEGVLGDETGGFTSYLKVGDSLEKVRMVDGIHITQQGGHLVSSFLLGFLR